MIGLKLGRYLSTQSDVVNRLSDRIFTDNVPQDRKRDYPRCTITVIGGQPEYGLGGELADLPKIVQVDVDDVKRQKATEVSDLIRVAITFFEGLWDDTVIKSCTVENERDQSFSPVDNSDSWTYRTSVDYRVTYVR